MRSRVGEADWPDRVRRLAGWLNPVVASPAAPLETFAALDALGPSLMPRTSRLQGIAMGLSALGARATASAAERLTNVAVPDEATLGRQQLQALSDDERARLRAAILSHDNDPIAVMGPELLVRRPGWLADGQRGRGVPDAMHWRPLITFIQTAMDAANAMVSVPGAFGSFGHDRLPSRHGSLRARRLRPSRRHRAAARRHRAELAVAGAGTRRTDQGPGPQGRPHPAGAPQRR